MSLLRDLRYAVRGLRRSPGFALVAIASLALGIGANTAIFTLVDAVLLTSLPVAEPDRLYNIYTVDGSNSEAGLIPVSVPNFRDLQSSLGSFESIVAIAGTGFSVDLGDDAPVGSPGELVSGDYFTTLGVTAQLGRLIQPSDDRIEGEGAVAVLSHATWMRIFGGDPGVIGRTIRLNQQPFTIVGVTPEGFKGHQTLTTGERIWVPFGMLRQVVPESILFFFTVRRALPLNVVGRLADGTSPEVARAELAAVSARLEQDYPDDNRDRGFRMVRTTEASVGANQSGALTRSSAMMMGIVALVLLIACANLANLLLARSTARSQELALRTSLGASRRLLVQQVVVESLTLSVLGGAIGLALASWGSRFLLGLASGMIPPEAVDLSMSGRVLGFTALLSIGTGVLFGLFPAIRVARQDPAVILKEGARGGQGLIRSPLRNALVISEVALALIGLVGAGLLLRSMQAAANTDFGFEIEGLGVAALSLSGMSVPDATRYLESATERALSVRGVESAGFASSPPLSPTQVRTLVPQGDQGEDGGSSFVTVVATMPGYLEAMGLPILEGRPLGPDDLVEGALPVVIANQALVDRYWPGEDPIGKRFTYFADPVVREVVGVTANVSLGDLNAADPPLAYMPFPQWPAGAAILHIRTGSDDPAILGAVQDALMDLDADRQPQSMQMAEEQLTQILRARRIGAGLVGTFGLVALGLAITGIYAVMSQLSEQRRHEIGIRMALGAESSSVLWLVVGQGMMMVGLGVLAGVAAALVAGRAIQGLLYGIAPHDPVTLVGVSVALSMVAFVACLIPALRATRVDPVEALGR